MARLVTRASRESKVLIQPVFDADHRGYGTRNIWRELQWQGHEIAR